MPRLLSAEERVTLARVAEATVRGGSFAPWQEGVPAPREEAERLEVLFLAGLLTREREEWGGCRYRLSESAREMLAEKFAVSSLSDLPSVEEIRDAASS